MTSVLFDARWLGPHGIGRFASEVSTRCGFMPLDIVGKPLALLDPLRIRQALLTHRVDHYFSPGYNPPLGKPCSFSFTLHDLMQLDFPALRSMAKSAYFDFIVRPGIKNAAVVFTVSEYSRKRILEWSGASPERVVSVSNGVDAHYTVQGLRWEHSRPYLLYVGNQRTHKNVEGLIDAFALSRLPKHFDLLLSGELSPCVSARVAMNGLELKVHGVGMVPESALPSLYRGAHAFVMPSRYEGFGLPLVEAMACGTPVLTSCLTAMPEVCGDAAVYFDPDDTESFVAGLNQLEDAALLNRLREMGLLQATKFNWDAVAKRVNTTIAELG